MNQWSEIKYFAGFDWARDHHDVVIIDQQNQVLGRLRFDHSSDGWKRFDQFITPYAPLGVAIETNCGPAVDQLIRRPVTVYPINPKSAKRYRERQMPGGSKTDEIDCLALAQALRMDGAAWKALNPTDKLTQKLRLLCRDEAHLINQRTQLVNQLQYALNEYYPLLLNAFDDWTKPATWDFVIEFPTPQLLVKAGKRRWEKFLHAHLLWRPETSAKRMELFAQAEQLCGSEAVTFAKSMQAVTAAKILRTVQQQLDDYRLKIQELFIQHPDHEVFGSLPGAGPTLAPRLLAEIGGDPKRFENAEHLQGTAGTAPVSYQSGQIARVYLRHHCDKFLRHVVHLWSDTSRHSCVWAQVYYQKKREEGKSHACALRCLGQRWLKIVWKMAQTHSTYDSELHARNQKQHGSWVLSLTTQEAK